MQWPLAAPLILVALAIHGEARPCSTPCSYGVTPAGGEVPANLPGIDWWYNGPVPASGSIGVEITETLPDGMSSTLPLVEELDGTEWVKRFSRPLKVGATYEVVIEHGCSYQGTERVTAATFTAVDMAPFPTAIGELLPDPSTVQGVVDVGTTNGSCSSRANVVYRRVRLELSDEALPWRNALITWWMSGRYRAWVMHDRPSSDPAERWERWMVGYVYHVCRAAESGVERGQPEGESEVFIQASLAGTKTWITSAPSTVALSCDPALAHLTGAGPECRGGVTSLLGLVLLIVGRVVSRCWQ